jgi:hypothetical protein
MVKVIDLPAGCELWGDPVNGHPMIRTPRDGWKVPAWVSFHFPSIDARNIFRAVKRYLDQKDMEWRSPGLEIRWKAADLAKISMELALKQCGRWSNDLKENEAMDVIMGRR